MAIELVLPAMEHKALYEAMMDEWLSFGGRLNPGALRSHGEPYETWLQWMRDDRDPLTCPEGSPPQTLYFLMENGELIGAATVRHCLNGRTLIDGGHIGLGIRPSKRRMGKGAEALALAVGKAREMGAGAVLLTCAEDNTASEKTMLKLGAVYENTLPNEDGEPVKRFWIRGE